MTEKIKNYLLVAKPGIIFGNLVTAAGGFLLASRGRIDITILLSTIIGISLVVASGCVFNNCIDRKMDRKMARTATASWPGDSCHRKVPLVCIVFGHRGDGIAMVATNVLSFPSCWPVLRSMWACTACT